jgi:hypothetical protein
MMMINHLQGTRNTLLLEKLIVPELVKALPPFTGSED